MPEDQLSEIVSRARVEEGMGGTLLSREELLKELERLHARVQERDGADFIAELVRLRRFMEDDPRLQQILDELRTNAEQIEADFQAADVELAPRLIELRRELVRIASDAADPEPRPRPEWPQRNHRWIYSMTNFDLVATDDPEAVKERHDLDDSKSGFFIRVLDSRLRELRFLIGKPPAQNISDTDQRPELEPISVRLAQLSHEHQQALRTLEQAVGAHGGFALQELNMFFEHAEPPAPSDGTPEDDHRYVNEMFGHSYFYSIQEAQRPVSRRNFSADQIEQLQRIVERLRPAEDHLFEALRERLIRTSERRPQVRDYFRDWLGSPYGAILVLAPAGQAVIQIVSHDGKNSGWLIAFAMIAAFLPPLARGLLTFLVRSHYLTFGGPRLDHGIWERVVHFLERIAQLDAIRFNTRIIVAAFAVVAIVLVLTLVVGLGIGTALLLLAFVALSLLRR